MNNIDPKGGKIECYDVKEYNTEDHLVGAATPADIAFLRAIQRKMATQLNAWKKKNPSKPFPFNPQCVPGKRGLCSSRKLASCAAAERAPLESHGRRRAQVCGAPVLTADVAPPTTIGPQTVLGAQSAGSRPERNRGFGPRQKRGNFSRI